MGILLKETCQMINNLIKKNLSGSVTQASRVTLK